MCVCRNLSIAVLLFHYKHSSGRHKHRSGRHKRSSGRSVSEDAPRFGNLCVYEPRAPRKKPLRLRKKPYDSRKKPSDLWKKPSNLQRRHTTNAFWKGVSNHSINFKDAYRITTSSVQLLVFQRVLNQNGTTTSKPRYWEGVQ